MAVPKRKITKSMKGNRRSHMALEEKSRAECSHCGAPKPSHRICPNCGHYRGKEILAPREG